MEIDNEKLIQIAKEKGIEIEVNSPNPGVYDKSTNTFYTFEELFPDIMKRNYLETKNSNEHPDI